MRTIHCDSVSHQCVSARWCVIDSCCQYR